MNGMAGGGAASLDSDMAWWRKAVIYEVYIRSYADGNGDGIGDIPGIRSRLPYLRDLGVDAIWVTPWYPSPQVDGGYDVSDFRDIDPLLGSIDDAENLIGDVHELGLRIIADIVPNHTSDRHRWFQSALAAGSGGPERDRYVFRRGRGANGDLPPNDWRSRLGGPAWTRVAEPDGTPGEWYLHLFTAGQPCLNWDNMNVRSEFLSILRFWFDRGIDGFRVDGATRLGKNLEMPEESPNPEGYGPGEHPFFDRDEVHEIFRDWRRVADEYSGERTFVAEAWLPIPERWARYVQPGGLHTAFNFGCLHAGWDAIRLGETIEMTTRAMGRVGAPSTWVLSSHDAVRLVTRFGRAETMQHHADKSKNYGRETDLNLGVRRARAAVLLALALPGVMYIYQGEELGLWEIQDLPEEALRDPFWEYSGRLIRGRDGCRVPLPWSGTEQPFGFTSGCTPPWLPQPDEWRDYTVEAQEGKRGSMLELYRAALRIRRDHPALGGGTLRWLEKSGQALSFARDPGFICAVNFSGDPYRIPGRGDILLTSGPLLGDCLPVDTAAWITLDKY